MTSNKTSTGRAKKGCFGYFRYEKKRRLLITAALFVLPVLALVIPWIYYGTRNNMWTILAVVGALPGCKSLVSLIMVLLRKPMDEGLYREISSHAGDLTMGYEMYMTFYEKSAMIDAVAICGNQVVAFSSDPKIDSGYMASNARKLLHQNGYKVDVKVQTEKRMFLERLDSMNAHKDSLRDGIRFTPDEKYPELSREELILHTWLALCL